VSRPARSAPRLLATAALATAGAAWSAPANEAPVEWAAWTASPRPIAMQGDARASDREAELLSRCGRGEAGLKEVATRIALDRTRGAARLDLDALTFALRSAGEPHVWPRAWVASGRALDHDATLAKLEAWGSGFHETGERRCGVAIARAPDGTEIVVAVALDAVADLAPLPTRAHVGFFMTLDARLLVRADDPHVIVQGPGTEPRSVPSWVTMTGGVPHLRASFVPDRPGAFTVQVVADPSSGPRPILEARVFADVAPPSRFEEGAAPGEDAPGPAGDDAARLAAMVGRLRQLEELPPLARDARLDAMAVAHARRMMTSRTVGHDVGDGDPVDRLERLGARARLVGENVAHAASTRLAHRALFESPSHRANLLRDDFDRLGVASVSDADGSVWVAEVFAAGLR